MTGCLRWTVSPVRGGRFGRAGIDGLEQAADLRMAALRTPLALTLPAG